MTWDSVPWFTGGGAQHSPEVGRLLAYAATSGAEGIVGVGDLLVRPLDVPAGKVRVLPGAAIILNRSTGGSQQSYVGRLPTEDVVDIAPTGSSSGRTDLVVARIEDPFTAGTPWQEPADPTVGPYIFTRVIPNVPASAVATSDAARRYIRDVRGESAIPLASVTLPANTGTVTAGMLKSLREVAIPRRRRDVSTVNLSPSDGVDRLDSTAVEWFPDAAANARWGSVEIPEWATEVRLVATWAQVVVPAGNTTGSLAVQLGNIGATGSVRSGTVGVDTPNDTNVARATYVLGDTVTIPAALRGTSQPIRPVGSMASTSSASSTIYLDHYSAFVLDLEFLEAPTEDDF